MINAREEKNSTRSRELEIVHVGGKETITEEFRVDPAKNVIFEQKLNMKVNYAILGSHSLLRP